MLGIQASETKGSRKMIILRVIKSMLNWRHKKISPFQIILLGFAGVILVGAFLLCLPISSKSGEWTNFLDAMFTSTSALCVTGLVVFDTATYWTIFGQVVILLLIQIGGMGVVMVASLLAIVSNRKISLLGRDTMKEAIAAHEMGSIVNFTIFILRGIFIIEIAGALIMMPVFCYDFGAKGIWLSVFHSISAFCNAGFDIMGETEQFSSLSSYASNPLINIVIMLLIFIGGIGFLVWEDFIKHRFHFSKYKTQSKVVLTVSLILILLPAIFFFFSEFSDAPFGKRLLMSLFQSVTTRTAGFNTAPLAALGHVAIVIMMFNMLIGGSSGSTAGGMKTTTIAVLFASTIAAFTKRKNVVLFKRRIEDSVVKNACAILLMYVFLFLVGGSTICMIEGLPLMTCLFEAASAIGTVGLTLGITSSLSAASHIILMLFMFFGRVGGLTLIYATIRTKNIQSKYPVDKISVG